MLKECTSRPSITCRVRSKHAAVFAVLVAFLLLRGGPLRAQGGMSVTEPASRPGSMSRLYFDGHKAILRGDFTAAERDFQEAIRRMANQSVAMGDDCQAQAYEGLGGVYLREGRYQDAVEALRRAAGLDPGLATTQLLLGQSYYELHQNSQAVATLGTALRLKPRDPQAMLYLGKAEIELGDYQAASDILTKLVESRPNDAKVVAALSTAYMKQTMQRIGSQGKVAPHSFEALQIAAVEAQSRADYKAAADDYRQALSINPNAPGLHYALGEALMNMKHDLAAAQEYHKEVELDPNNSRALWRLGYFTLHQDPEKACEYLDRSIRLDPQRAGAVLSYGRALAMTGQTEKAVAQFLRALQLKPDLVTPHYLLALAYHKLGQEAASKTELARFEALSKQKSERDQERVEAVVESSRRSSSDSAPTQPPLQPSPTQSSSGVAPAAKHP